jgi:hypothetical protein
MLRMTINTNIANQTKFQDLTGEEKRRAVVIEIEEIAEVVKWADRLYVDCMMHADERLDAVEQALDELEAGE